MNDSNKPFTNMRSLSNAFAKALNLISSDIENHHQQVAYLSYMIAREMGFSEEDLETVLFAALAHDIGFITIEEEKTVQEIEGQAAELAQVGYNIISRFPGAVCWNGL